MNILKDGTAWLEVIVKVYWHIGNEAEEYNHQTHTIRVNPECEDLKQEAQSKLTALGIKGAITSYRFI